MDIGTKIKEARNKQNMTLKELSQQSGLSVGFLSQLERGLTSIAVDSLEHLATILKLPLANFFDMPSGKDKYVVRSYERQILNIQDGGIITYNLSLNLEDKVILPRLIELRPSKSDENVMLYAHEGEEFIYVFEGILTVCLDKNSYDLCPGDSIHFNSKIEHNWMNHTNKTVKMLTVNTPNGLSCGKSHG